MANRRTTGDFKQATNRKKKQKVIFICTDNACRSQMAEAIVNSRLGFKWKAYSAGTRPADRVHPLTIEVLEEIGISHNGRTKTIYEFEDQDFDLIVTVCSLAAEKNSFWMGKGKRQHMGFPDPAQAIGDEEEVRQIFRKVRDDIAKKIPELLRVFESN